VIDFFATAPDRGCYPPIPVAAFMLRKKSTDAIFQSGALILCLQQILLMIERAAGQVGHVKKLRKRVTLPQLSHDFRFFCCAAFVFA
jgi:hypothetical protein